MIRQRKFFSVAAAVWILSASGLSAQIIIDQFLDGTRNVFATAGNPDSVLTNIVIDGQNSQRQLSASASGDFALDTEVLSSVLVVDGAPQSGGSGTADAQVEYLGYSLNLGSNTYFAMTLNKVVGAPIAGFVFENGLTQITGAAQLTATNVGYTVFIDLTQLSGYTPGFGNGVDGVMLLLGGATNPFFIEIESLEFTAVPEPSAMGLGAAGLFAVWLLRRRKAAAESGKR